MCWRIFLRGKSLLRNARTVRSPEWNYWAFRGITRAENSLIRERLASFSIIPLSPVIEERTIALRQSRKIKLPDAIIAATAISENIELLTLDQHLKSVVAEGLKG